MGLKKFLKGLGVVAIILTIAPLMALNQWWIRIFDFPHVQLTFLTLIALLVYFLRFDLRSTGDYFFISALFACFIFQLLKIWPYTQLASEEIYAARDASEKKRLKLFASNVFQENRDWKKVVKEAKKLDADILVFTETNSWWIDKLERGLDGKNYEKIKVPLDNTYGMSLFSKLKLSDVAVRYLVDDSIPSIEAKVTLPTGDKIQLFAIHPTPPMPTENPKSTERDAELMTVALKCRNMDLPIVVLGDFNDVAWSQSTKKFQQISGLLDMRKGRGFFNTYDANSILLRWPLDHVFVSSHFRYDTLCLGDNVGSDHFPIYASVVLSKDRAAEQQLEPPSEEMIESAKTEIRKAKEKG